VIFMVSLVFSWWFKTVRQYGGVISFVSVVAFVVKSVVNSQPAAN